MTKHRCYACDDKNPERIVTNSDDGWVFNFIERFVGPPNRAHGGIAVGALTCPALQLAEHDGMLDPVALHVSGRLNFPAPLTKPIRVTAFPEQGRYRVRMHEDNKVLLDGVVEVADIETEVGSVLQEPPPERVEQLKALAELANANIEGTTLFTKLRQSFEAAGLPWKGMRCFGCSEVQGALKLHHRVARRGDTWTLWEVERSFTDGNDRLAAAIIAAALDCSNQYTPAAHDPQFLIRVLREKKIWMTGTYRVHFLRVPPIEIEGDYRVVAHYLAQEGRKLFSMSALLDRDGNVYAMGEAVAVILDLPDEMLGTKSH
jgi:hypothetical protein